MSWKAYLFVAVLAAVGAGCGNKAVQTRERATLAALSKYPGNAKTSDQVQLAAIDDPGAKRIEIVNLTDRTITTPTIWVNQNFVHKAETIEPRGQVRVRYDELLEQGAGVRDVDMANLPVKTVEIQTADGLFTVQGPSRK